MSFEAMRGGGDPAARELALSQRAWKAAVDSAASLGVPRSAMDGLVEDAYDVRSYERAHRRLELLLASFASAGL